MAIERIYLTIDEARNNLGTDRIYAPRSRYRNYCPGEPLEAYRAWLDAQLAEEPSYLLGLTTFKFIGAPIPLDQPCWLDVLINKFKQTYPTL